MPLVVGNSLSTVAAGVLYLSFMSAFSSLGPFVLRQEGKALFGAALLALSLASACSDRTAATVDTRQPVARATMSAPRERHEEGGSPLMPPTRFYVTPRKALPVGCGADFSVELRAEAGGPVLAQGELSASLSLARILLERCQTPSHGILTCDPTTGGVPITVEAAPELDRHHSCSDGVFLDDASDLVPAQPLSPLTPLPLRWHVVSLAI